MDCGRIVFERETAAFFFYEHRHRDGQERLQNFLHRDGACAGSAAAMRRGESFVQVQVHHVDAEIAGARDAGQRVHVGAVHVEQRALGRAEFRRFPAMRSSKMPSVDGVGDHQRGDVFGLTSSRR